MFSRPATVSVSAQRVSHCVYAAATSALAVVPLTTVGVTPPLPPCVAVTRRRLLCGKNFSSSVTTPKGVTCSATHCPCPSVLDRNKSATHFFTASLYFLQSTATASATQRCFGKPLGLSQCYQTLSTPTPSSPWSHHLRMSWALRDRPSCSLLPHRLMLYADLANCFSLTSQTRRGLASHKLHYQCNVFRDSCHCDVHIGSSNSLAVPQPLHNVVTLWYSPYTLSSPNRTASSHVRTLCHSLRRRSFTSAATSTAATPPATSSASSNSKANQKNPPKPLLWVSVGWSVSAAVLLASVYGLLATLSTVPGDELLAKLEEYNLRATDYLSDLIDNYFPHSTEPLLPDLRDLDFPENLPTLVVDLDKTVVHLEYDRRNGWRVVKRPGADRFFRDLISYYELVVWSDDNFPVAQEVMAKWGVPVVGCIHRDQCKKRAGHFIKDLSRLGRRLDRTIILDHDKQAFRLQPENGIQIREFTGDPDDRELDNLVDLLKTIALSPEDVRRQLDEQGGGDVDVGRRFSLRKTEQEKKSEARRSLGRAFGMGGSPGSNSAPAAAAGEFGVGAKVSPFGFR